MHYSEDYLQSNLVVVDSNIFTKNEYFLEAGIIEHMAQSVALHTGYQFFLLKKPAPTGYIGSIKNLEINRLPKTGELMITEVKLIKEFAGVTLVAIETKINDEIIAKGHMKTVLAT
jgi:predicted hotdog family 3-hydroxylacyl-ACP dehydratase